VIASGIGAVGASRDSRRPALLFDAGFVPPCGFSGAAPELVGPGRTREKAVSCSSEWESGRAEGSEHSRHFALVLRDFPKQRELQKSAGNRVERGRAGFGAGSGVQGMGRH